MTTQVRLVAMITLVLLAGALPLAGCASEDAASSFLVAPGKYVLYQCDDIERAAKAALARQQELERLMARASATAAGQLIGDAAYGTELASIRGQLRDLHTTARDKNCGPMPGEAPAAPPTTATIH